MLHARYRQFAGRICGDVKHETGDNLEVGHKDLKVKFDITIKLEQLKSSTVNMKKEDDSGALNLVKNCA